MKEWEAYVNNVYKGWALAENIDEVKSRFYEKYPQYKGLNVEFTSIDPKTRYEKTIKRLKIINSNIHKTESCKESLKHRIILEFNMKYYKSKNYKI